MSNRGFRLIASATVVSGGGVALALARGDAGHGAPLKVQNSRRFIIRSPRRRAQQRLGSLCRVPSREIYGTRTAAAGSCQAPNTSLVPVYDRITFFGNYALRIS